MKTSTLILIAIIQAVSIAESNVPYLYNPYSPIINNSAGFINYYDLYSQKDVFFNPDTGEAVPQLSKDVILSPIGKLSSFILVSMAQKRVYGDMPCNCTESSCECCADIKIDALKFNQRGCISFTVPEQNTTLDSTVSFENVTVLESRSPLKVDLPALCAPIPYILILSGCAKFYNLHRDGNNFAGCVNLEMRITGAQTALFEVRFVCVKIGLNGISFSRPPTTTVASTAALPPSKPKVNATATQQPQ